MDRKEVDFIIVGQGLAGTSMAIRLLDEGKSLVIIDEGKEQSASLISSGIINPITGRRYVKSWMFDDLLPFALEFYKKLERRWNVKIIKPIQLLRALSNVLEENLWVGQSGKEDYQEYFGSIRKEGRLVSQFKNQVVLGEVKSAFQVDIRTLIQLARKEFLKKNLLIQQKVNIEDISFDSLIHFKNIRAKQIIFAEGWNVINNPLFSSLPFDPTKGEVFITQLDEYHLTEVVKNNKFMVPWAEDRYWVGSTNQNGVNNDSPDFKKQGELKTFLQDYVKSECEILEKWTAVRPSTKQRRPIIGRHLNHTHTFLFNGLGTKGASLAPYFSNILCNHILKGLPIPHEVNIEKYQY